ncbi:TylF/MycF/NovP-related O-methyltransferase [Candidatus Pelagibacter sp. HIMB1715]|uniref:TylF/MycF/NovP-related O-methyltransferase n=1 Tax=Candidatus Pelagibacter sp. HIMB1715 TaxID=3413369 RepID=UPI003F83DA8E
MNNNYKEYVYDLMGVEGPHKKIISPYRFWYKHIERNALKNNGDIIELGVYRGKSLITAALILKELNSKKTIFGFDTFEGLPKSSKFDELIQFQEKNYFSKKHINEVLNNIKLKKQLTKIKKFTPHNI